MFKGNKYTEVIWKRMTLSCNKPNKCFLTVFGEVVMLSNIIDTVDGVVLIGKKFK